MKDIPVRILLGLFCGGGEESYECLPCFPLRIRAGPGLVGKNTKGYCGAAWARFGSGVLNSQNTAMPECCSSCAQTDVMLRHCAIYCISISWSTHRLDLCLHSLQGKFLFRWWEESIRSASKSFGRLLVARQPLPPPCQCLICIGKYESLFLLRMTVHC